MGIKVEVNKPNNIMSNYLTVLFIVFSSTAYCQSNNASEIFVRHDTTILKAEESQWIVKSLVKNDPSLTGEIGKSIPRLILQAIQKGKLKAIDPESNQPIPAKKILTWQMRVDTLPDYDLEGNVKGYRSLQAVRDGSSITQIRV